MSRATSVAFSAHPGLLSENRLERLKQARERINASLASAKLQTGPRIHLQAELQGVEQQLADHAAAQAKSAKI